MCLLAYIQSHKAVLLYIARQRFERVVKNVVKTVLKTSANQIISRQLDKHLKVGPIFYYMYFISLF